VKQPGGKLQIHNNDAETASDDLLDDEEEFLLREITALEAKPMVIFLTV
jgi:hypothetical protein